MLYKEKSGNLYSDTPSSEAVLPNDILKNVYNLKYFWANALFGSRVDCRPKNCRAKKCRQKSVACRIVAAKNCRLRQIVAYGKLSPTANCRRL
jgi:hypothetical protein